MAGGPVENDGKDDRDHDAHANERRQSGPGFPGGLSRYPARTMRWAARCWCVAG